MQVQDVLNSQSALFQLANQKLPAKTAYRIAKAITKCRAISQSFEKARYDFILSIPGVTLSEDKKTFNIEGHESEIEDGVKKMAEAEIENDFHRITLANLEGIQIEPINLIGLDWFIADLEIVAG